MTQQTALDLITQLPAVETPTPPPQLDYRSNPSLGQAAIQEPATFSRDQPLDAKEVLMPPQKMLGHIGYSLNPMEPPPNQMTDQNLPLSYGNVPDAGYGQGPSIGTYDFYGQNS